MFQYHNTGRDWRCGHGSQTFTNHVMKEGFLSVVGSQSLDGGGNERHGEGGLFGYKMLLPSGGGDFDDQEMFSKEQLSGIWGALP